ncbi:MAG: TfoX/Sxy family protein [Verrucomicrobia bacterium]|nr:TfoX/Sxy family protein [Verrucomicrobiota bacterium]
MGTKASTADFILDQLRSLNKVAVKKMFGEYALYCDGKVVGLICDEQLFLKITEQVKAAVGDRYRERFPYPGAKPAMLIENVDDGPWLTALVKLTAEQLPLPDLKKKRKKKSK